MNHLDFNPTACSRGELVDAYMDQVQRTGQMFDEVVALGRRQHALEEFIAALVERTLEGNRCLLGECEPQWGAHAGRPMHLEPCSLAAGEELLRHTVKNRTHYGTQAAE